MVQPIGALPEGTTIFYWRNGLNLPFISSADGLLKKSDARVSLLGRGIMLKKVMETIGGRELFRANYSQTIYLWSTDGTEYEK